MKNFWEDLPRPFTLLAPMEDVTDHTFRRLVQEVAPPNVFMTEFVSAEILMSTRPQKALPRLIIHKTSPEDSLDIPLVAQIWGLSPDAFFKAAELIRSKGFSGIDINMGCPARKIAKRGACSGLIGNPALAGELISAAKEGAGDLPVSVKTRIGLKKRVTESWASFLLDQNIAALTIHGRVAAQMSEGEADWDEIAKVVALKQSRTDCKTLIIGNGDVFDRETLATRMATPGLDGVMVGRGIFHDPCIFGNFQRSPFLEWSTQEKLELLARHIRYFNEDWKGAKNFDLLKRFMKIYTRGFEGHLELRESLMDSLCPQDVLAHLTPWLV